MLLYTDDGDALVPVAHERLHPQSVLVRRSTLEDVFLRLTGPHARRLMAYALRAFEYWLYSYRRVWRGSDRHEHVGPVLYLTALGVGLGTLVNSGSTPLGVPYLDFVAPGHARGDGDADRAFESSFPVMARDPLDAASTTRCSRRRCASRDLIVGHLLYVATRVAVVGGDLSRDPRRVRRAALAARARSRCPSSCSIGLAFAAPVSAFSAWLERDEVFNPLFRFGVMPMFLFSGTFFPVTRLPHGLREVAYATPLWHGVDLHART